MKDIRNVVEFTELLGHAEEIGFSWNEAHTILVDDEVLPMYESAGEPKGWYLQELDEFLLSKESKKILTSFMEKNKVNFINVIAE